MGVMMDPKNHNIQRATFAGGCFWCTESDFARCAGVRLTISGYTGGHLENPTYADVSSGLSGHWEAVQIHFNKEQISYDQLLDIFWRHIDPTDAGGQFVDRGSQYRTAIFYHSDNQKQLAQQSKQRLATSGRFAKSIVTDVLQAGKFYPAETYHQNYYKQNPLRYKFYRSNSGRDQFLSRIWGGDMSQFQSTL